MKCTRIALALALVGALAGCDGGSRGSGITTAEGNVESVQTALHAPAAATRLGRLASLWRWLAPERTAEADAGLGGIRVLVEGTMVEDETDGDGSFSLRGDFEGDVVIRFEVPASGMSARIPVNAPAGGVLTLESVHLDTTSGAATAETQSVVFDALVAGADCVASTLDLVSRHRNATDTDVYAVRLQDSSIREIDGTPLSCPDLHEGDAVDVRGSVNDDGTFGHAEIVRR